MPRQAYEKQIKDTSRKQIKTAADEWAFRHSGIRTFLSEDIISTAAHWGIQSQRVLHLWSWTIHDLYEQLDHALVANFNSKPNWFQLAMLMHPAIS